MVTKKTTADPEVRQLLDELLELRQELILAADVPHRPLQQIHGNFCDSAQNLLHYLALRRRDMRPLQQRLTAAGLSSLGRAESHVLATLDALLNILHRLAGRSWSPAEHAVSFSRGSALLAEHAHSLLGPSHSERGVRIMVTMPSGAGA